MSVRSLLASIMGIAVLSGCVTIPTGPAVMVLPGSRKSLDQFRIDEAACRDYAQMAIGGANAAQPANDAAAANAVVGSAIGAAAGAIIGSASGQAGAGAAIGAGTGLLFGSAAGSNVSGYSQYQLQRNYDIAYIQCMYARGNQVPGRVAYRGATPYYGPPPSAPAATYPPPDYPPPSGAASGSYPPPPGAASGSYPPPNYPAPRQ
jgi:hypothetical protein